MPLLGPNGQPLNTDPPADAHPVPDEAAAAYDGPKAIPAITAFIIYQLPTGQWQVSDDLNDPIVADRKPHGDDFTSACANVLRDVQTQEIALASANLVLSNVGGAVMQAQMEFGKRMKEQMDIQAAQQQIEEQTRKAGGRR